MIARLWRALPWVGLGLLLIAVFVLGGIGPEVGPDANVPIRLLLIAVGSALGVLGALLVARVWRLVQDWRAEVAGTRLRLRVLAVLMLVMMPPMLLMFVFPVRYLYRSIDDFFSVEIGAALNGAIALGRDVVNREVNRARDNVVLLSDQLRDTPDRDNQMDRALEADLTLLELTLFAADGRVRYTTSADPRFLLPRLPDASVLAIARRDGSTADTEGEGVQTVLRALTLIGDDVLLARYAAPTTILEQVSAIEVQAAGYQQLEFLRRALKYTLAFVLSLVLVLGMLLSFFLAFSLSRRMAAPITRLADATRRVAGGDLQVQVPEDGRDELGFLARDFNHMTTQLGEARQRVEAAAAREQAERSMLQTVLERLSSGVLGIDRGGRLRTVNPAAIDILDAALEPFVGLPLQGIAAQYPALEGLVTALDAARARAANEWRGEVAVQRAGGRQLLMVRSALLRDHLDLAQVVLIDDQSEYGRAQRESAWAEVAQRLAHEIKNPLTPIQLSAERLAHKLSSKVEGADRDLLERSTRTIVSQVETLKNMVNAFSDYARPPKLQFARVALATLLTEMADLYGSQGAEVRVEVDPRLHIRGDVHRLRQLLQNLIKNAIEAMPEGQTARIDCAAQTLQDGSRTGVELTLRDYGPGIPDGVRERLFEPYTTTKVKGTGLGLAIVRKIVEEHSAQIRAESASPHGTIIRLRFALSLQG